MMACCVITLKAAKPLIQTGRHWTRMEMETDSFIHETPNDRTPTRPIKYKKTSTPLITSILKSIPHLTSNRTSSIKFRYLCLCCILFGIWCLLVLDSSSKRKKSIQTSTHSNFFIHNYSLIQNIQQLETLYAKQSRQPEPLCDSNFLPTARFPCACSDPLIPISKMSDQRWSDRWTTFFDQNKKQLLESKEKNVQVIFYGDSITHGWRKSENAPVFQSLFSKEAGGEYEGLAMGLPGDRTVHLLWRLQNGEQPNATSTQRPLVYWVLIGTNDLGSGCTPEVVLVGILRVVEELLLQQPTSTIVINGILPRSSSLQQGYLLYNHSYWKAIEAINDALETYSQHRSNRVHYFDARDIFLVNSTVQDESQLQIQLDWMPDLLHPSQSGYQRWGEAIVTKLKTIIR